VEEEGSAFANLIGREPDPAFAMQMTEECRRLLEKLKDPELRSIVIWKMEGYTNEEIAPKVGRALPTIERRLRLIRARWGKEIGSE
jgi:DNA-directed RNA polymerase specialized sigma24 family protein